MKKTITILLIFISIISYAQQPTLEWVQSYGGIENDFSESIVVDDNGNTYATGSFIDTVDFDPGNGVFNLISASNYNPDISIHKLDSNGNLLWAKSIGNIGAEYGKKIALDNSGNVYVAGTFVDTVDFDPGVGVFNLNNPSSRDAFILKLDSDGSFVWAKSISSSNAQNVFAIAADALGNVYTGGTFSQTADFDPGATEFELTSNGSGDYFIQKLDSNGDFVWAQSFGGASYDYVYGILIDDNNDVLMTGGFKDTVDFDPGVGTSNFISNGGFDYFIQKLDENGDLLWVKTTGGVGSDIGIALTQGSSGDIYVGGKFSDTVDFDFGTGTTDVISNGSADYFIQRLTTNGDLIWVKSVGGTAADELKALACDLRENIYVLGYFNDTVDFDPNAGDTTIVSNGVNDISIQKLDSTGNLIWVKTYGSVGYDNGNAVVADQQGNIYLTGIFQDTLSLIIPDSSLHSNGGYDGFIMKLSQIEEDTVIVDTVIVDTIQALNELNISQIQLYPNPTRGQFSITLDENSTQIDLQILDLSGRVVFETSSPKKPVIKLNFEAPKGIYFVRIDNGRNQSMIKLIKQ